MLRIKGITNIIQDTVQRWSASSDSRTLIQLQITSQYLRKIIIMIIFNQTLRLVFKSVIISSKLFFFNGCNSLPIYNQLMPQKDSALFKCITVSSQRIHNVNYFIDGCNYTNSSDSLNLFLQMLGARMEEKRVLYTQLNSLLLKDLNQLFQIDHQQRVAPMTDSSFNNDPIQDYVTTAGCGCRCGFLSLPTTLSVLVLLIQLLIRYYQLRFIVSPILSAKIHISAINKKPQIDLIQLPAKASSWSQSRCLQASHLIFKIDRSNTLSLTSEKDIQYSNINIPNHLWTY